MRSIDNMQGYTLLDNVQGYTLLDNVQGVTPCLGVVVPKARQGA